MAYYRVLRNIVVGDEVVNGNQIVNLPFSDSLINKMFSLGVISALNTPPIDKIPELKRYKKRLEKAGINNLQDFLECPDNTLSELLKIDVEQTENTKRQYINQYLILEKNNCNC